LAQTPFWILRFDTTKFPQQHWFFLLSSSFTYPKAGLAFGANAEAVATQAAKQRAVFIFITRVVGEMHDAWEQR
jgi:hypothetical protein